MPPAKTNTPSTVDPAAGFAALEAKVEEVQLDAAIEAEHALEDAAEAASVMALEPAVYADAKPGDDMLHDVEFKPPAGAGGPSFEPPAPFTTLFSALAAWTEGGMRLQAENLVALSRARSPNELLAAQLAFGKQAVDLYTSNMARLIQAIPFPPGETAPAQRGL